MPMSLHKCARTMCYGTLRLRCLVGGYDEVAVERVGERKKRRRIEEVGERWEVFYTPRHMRTFPKWTAICSCHFYFPGLLNVAGDHAEP